jgi:hypothetical protein
MIAKPKADLETRMALAVSLINAMSLRLDAMEARVAALINDPRRISAHQEHAENGADIHAHIIDALISLAAAERCVTVGIIRSTERGRVASWARQWVYLEAHKLGIPDATIGRIMRRDRTSVIHGRQAEAARRLQNGAEGV